MKRAISLGTVTFDRKLYYANEYESTGVSASSQRTIDGGVIVWEQANLDSVKDIILDSGTNYPISETNLQEIIALADGSLGQSYTLTFADLTTETVRFKHEANPVEAEPLWEGACDFFVTIKLAKV